MVVVSNECDCESVLPITMEPIEIRYILSFDKWLGLKQRNECFGSTKTSAKLCQLNDSKLNNVQVTGLDSDFATKDLN